MRRKYFSQARPEGRVVPRWTVTLACAALSVGLVACAANPGTGRSRRGMSEEDEIEQGRQAAVEVEQSMGFAWSAELNAYVARIGQRLAKHSSRSHLEYEFHVVDMKEPNAFALPGGYIYVSRGLLALMNNEDELATVLGHEIGHVAARHSVQRQATGCTLALFPASWAAGTPIPASASTCSTTASNAAATMLF